MTDQPPRWPGPSDRRHLTFVEEARVVEENGAFLLDDEAIGDHCMIINVTLALLSRFFTLGAAKTEDESTVMGLGARVYNSSAAALYLTPGSGNICRTPCSATTMAAQRSASGRSVVSCTRSRVRGLTPLSAAASAARAASTVGSPILVVFHVCAMKSRSSSIVSA